MFSLILLVACGKKRQEPPMPLTMEMIKSLLTDNSILVLRKREV